MSIGFCVLLAAISLGLFLFGYARHLDLFKVQPQYTVVGDHGDGLFNLWVMEHAIQSAPRGPAALSDGRIFWPEHEDTFWWSDNLIVPSLMYALLTWFFEQPLAAYWWTVFFFSAAGFACYLVFFAELFCAVRASGRKLPEWLLLLAPLFVYLTFFSQIRMRDYAHFQTLSSCFMATLLLGCMRYLKTHRRKDFFLAAVSQLLLLYSAPYYAVVGIVVLLFLLYMWLIDRRETPGECLRKNAVSILLVSPPFLWAVWKYAQGRHIVYDLVTMRWLSMRTANFYTPLYGWVRDALVSVLPPDRIAENPGGYPGAGILVGTILMMLYWLYANKERIPRTLKDPVLSAMLFLFVLTTLDMQELKWFTCYLRFWLGFLFLGWFVFYWRRKPRSHVERYAAFLIGAAVLFFGTASGPDHLFRYNSFDPGLWRLLSSIIPGYGNMRAVMRFAVLGQLALAGLLYLALLHCSARSAFSRKMAISLALVLGLLQFSETVHGRIRRQHVDFAHLSLTRVEEKFFAGLEGAMLALPSAPFHGNTSHMLRWRRCLQLNLLNGYSGRSTPAFDEIMRRERTHGVGSEEQIALARERGADYVCVVSSCIDESREKALRSQMEVVFENERFLVFAFLD